MSPSPAFRMSTANRFIPLGLIVLGAITAISGLLSDPARTWPSLLQNTFYLLGLTLSATLFLATQRLAGSRWSGSLRRIAEAFMLVVPVASLLLLSLWFGRQTLYSWARPGAFAHESPLAGKAQYLQPQWILARTVLACVLWTVFALLFRKRSLDQDEHPGSNLIFHHRLTRYSALFVPIFAVTFSLASFDWLISLDPKWFSTMFAVYVFAGMFVQGIAAITLATVILSRAGYLGDSINESRLHDLGKMVFAFCTFWAYIWVCQYLLIWYGNIPEEVTYYATRTSPQWVFLFALNFLLNWVVPFLVLLSARAKQNPRTLTIVSIIVLFGRWIDLYVMIMPSQGATPKLGIPEILIAAGYGALLYFIFLLTLERAPMVPVNDPILAFELVPAQHSEQLSDSIGFRE